jgi:hypothetical protein
MSFTEAFVPYSTAYASGYRGIGGIEVPLKKSKIFGLEGSFAYGQNNLRLSKLDVNPVLVKSYGLRESRVSGDIVAHSPSAYRGARPYVVFGAEYDRFSPSRSATTLATTTGFAYAPVARLSSQGTGGVNFGGGIDLKMSSKLGLRLDVRDHVTSSPTLGLPSGPTSSSAAYFPVSGSAHDVEYSIGFVYHFGK